MSFENYFPLWNDLNTAQKKVISDNLITRDVKKGTIIHNGNLDCTGLLLVKSGQLRTYILSDEGREITLYRLFDMDMCLLSASCIMQSIQFEVSRPRQHRHLKRKNSILFLVFLDFPHFFIHSGWQDTLF